MTAAQLDMFAESEAAEREAIENSGPCLFASPTRGFFNRANEFREWVATYGGFASLVGMPHAWVPGLTAPNWRTEVCRPTVLGVSLGCRCFVRDCLCVGGLIHRGACLHCDWEGEVRTHCNAAVEDAHDHAWPGWRDLPVVTRSPGRSSSEKGKAELRKWADGVNAVYPEGWLESGGPIRTHREPPGHRHVPNATGFGGYDLSSETRT